MDTDIIFVSIIFIHLLRTSTHSLIHLYYSHRHRQTNNEVHTCISATHILRHTNKPIIEKSTHWLLYVRRRCHSLMIHLKTLFVIRRGTRWCNILMTPDCRYLTNATCSGIARISESLSTGI